MATLQIPQNGKAIKGRTKRAVLGVDLTAMVDLAFLLITFFMLTTALAKMRMMDITEPAEGPSAPWPESRTMTILLGKNNKAVYYLGEAKMAQMQVADLSIIHQAILANKSIVANTHQDSKGKRMLVIIKPTNTAVYKNFVDIIDEMQINGIATYTIADKQILAQEKDFMQAKGL